MRGREFAFGGIVCVAASFFALGSAGCDKAPGEFEDTRKADNGTLVKPPAEPVRAPAFDAAFTVTPRFDKATSTVVVTLAIAPGFHAYAAGEEVGKPVELVVAPKNGWQLDGAAQIPAGTKKDLGDLGTSMILEGEVQVKAKVKGGSGDIAGELRVQVCTDGACDRPRSHPFTITGA